MTYKEWTIILILGCIVWFVVCLGVRDSAKAGGYDIGYRAAWDDHQAGRIECVVSVKHPEWLKEGK